MKQHGLLQLFLENKSFLLLSHPPRLLQDVFARRLQEDVLQTRFQDVLKTFWRRLGRQNKCYTEDVYKMSSTRLHEDESLFGKILKNYLWRVQFHESCRLITCNFEMVLLSFGEHLFQGIIFSGCFQKQDM